MVKHETPASKKKIASLVSAMFIPVSMWVINMVLVVQQVIQGTLLSSIVTGIIAGLLIFFIEKNIIMSNGSKAIMTFRVLLGLIIAFLGSLAFDEIIFKNDIDQQLDVNKERLIQNAQENVRQRFTPLIAQQRELVSKKYDVWLNSLNDAKLEATGEGGTKKRGVFIVTNLKMSIAKTNETDYLSAKQDLTLLETRGAQEQSNVKIEIEKSFRQNAMLHRIQGLFDLIKRNTWMMLVYGLVTTFLFMLEFIVVLLKVYLPTTNYEKKIKLIEEISEKRMERLKQHDEKYYDIGRIHSMNPNGKVPLATSNVFSTFMHN
jgi:hypothetical protein